MSGGRTPNRTPKSPRPGSGAETVSPLRQTRLEEKQQLTELNKRLEQYILRQREKDAGAGAWEKYAEELKRQHQELIASMELKHKEQLEELRTDRDRLATLRAQLDTQVKQVSRDLSIKTQEATALAADVEMLSKEKARLEPEVLKLRRELDGLRKKFNDVTVENEKLKSENLNLKERLATAESLLRTVQEDLDRYRARTEPELRGLREQVSDLTAKLAHVEEEVRREFAQQLSELLADHQEEWQQKQQKALEAMKEAYDEKLDAYRDHLQRSGHELEELKNSLKDVEAQLSKKDMEHGFLSVKLKDTEIELNEIREENIRLREQPNKEIENLKHILNRFRQAVKVKDEEIERLFDVKIELMLEIQAYRELLENEERRLGYGPNKKRKVGAHAAVQADSEEPALVFGGNDPEGGKLVVRNDSLNEVSLNGWSLQSKRNKVAYKFPADLVLSGGQSVTVWTGEDAASHQNEFDFAWLSANIWSATGDHVLLVNPSGTVTDEYAIIGSQADAAEDKSAADVRSEAVQADMNGADDHEAEEAPQQDVEEEQQMEEQEEQEEQEEEVEEEEEEEQEEEEEKKKSQGGLLDTLKNLFK